MATLEEAILWVHITAGSVALFAGLGALVTTKGGQRHREAGRLFLRAMTIVIGTVPLLLAFDPGSFLRQFLTLVAVFSGYFAFSGYRVLSRKRPVDRAHAGDWIAAGFVILASLALGVTGLELVMGDTAFGIVLTVFGAIGLSAGISDIRTFHNLDRRTPWMTDHLGRMIGAYIATVTAVSAVNLTMLPPVVRWLWPTAVGLPLIWYWERKYGATGPFARLMPN